MNSYYKLRQLFYYKVRQVLQSAMIFTNCDRKWALKLLGDGAYLKKNGKRTLVSKTLQTIVLPLLCTDWDRLLSRVHEKQTRMCSNVRAPYFLLLKWRRGCMENFLHLDQR